MFRMYILPPSSVSKSKASKQQACFLLHRHLKSNIVIHMFQGVLAAVPLAYVLPAVSYLKLEEGSLFSHKKFPALCLAVFGVIIAVLGMVMLITNSNKVDTCSHGNEPPYCLLLVTTGQEVLNGLKNYSIV